jgi:hypothetical protein
VLRALGEARTLDSLTASERARARREVLGVLARFPGVPSFWWMSYRLAEAAGDKAGAWEALLHARDLTPENPRFKGMSLLVAVWALPRARAEQHLAGVRGALEHEAAEVCLMYAVAEINLARKASPAEQKARWSRARRAADSGIARAPSEGLHKSLRATQLVLDALVSGREPTIEVLYMAGLSELASSVRPSANVVDLLTARLRQQVPARAA